MLPENTKLLSICCTFRRPQMLKQMIDSFHKTKSEGTEIFVYLHDDDPRLDEYKSIIGNNRHVIGKHRNLQEVANHVVFDIYPGIQYYQLICDDHLYHTQGWDTLLTDALKRSSNDWGFACGRDLINGDNWHLFQHPSAEVWSWKMAKTLGYVYPRNLNGMNMDYYTKDLASAINGLVFVPEVVIEHLWYGNCGREEDENIKERYTKASLELGEKNYRDWVAKEKMSSIARINEAREKEKNEG